MAAWPASEWGCGNTQARGAFFGVTSCAGNAAMGCVMAMVVLEGGCVGAGSAGIAPQSRASSGVGRVVVEADE